MSYWFVVTLDSFGIVYALGWAPLVWYYLYSDANLEVETFLTLSHPYKSTLKGNITEMQLIFYDHKWIINKKLLSIQLVLFNFHFINGEMYTCANKGDSLTLQKTFHLLFALIIGWCLELFSKVCVEIDSFVNPGFTIYIIASIVHVKGKPL